MDIPAGYEQIDKYNGTMAHKFNHRFYKYKIQQSYVRSQPCLIFFILKWLSPKLLFFAKLSQAEPWNTVFTGFSGLPRQPHTVSWQL